MRNGLNTDHTQYTLPSQTRKRHQNKKKEKEGKPQEKKKKGNYKSAAWVKTEKLFLYFELYYRDTQYPQHYCNISS